ncbi:hypothetical protein MHUMG1_10149 [Metarhizium humberi]|uniref:2EXR domain-containing protein n=1 Tax=Metarhizium humberi TaxID=2596975 RepID=A0A9P8M224_9HYPO|nr:hypothetical protein MHUMG1_10149 [Metarhizium humberi]
MTTFQPFPRLPCELRALVWALTAQPRTVPLRAKYEARLTRPNHQHNKYTSEIACLFSPIPVPPILHTCQESRKQSSYEKLFYSQETEPRYVWVNLDLDMLDVGEASLEYLEHNGSRVRRLKFEARNFDEYWFHFESQKLLWFTNLVECHVVSGDGLEAWWGAWQDFYWSCKREDLKFIDKKTGETMNSYEVDEMMDKIQAEDWRQAELEEEEALAEEMAAASMDTE